MLICASFSKHKMHKRRLKESKPGMTVSAKRSQRPTHNQRMSRQSATTKRTLRGNFRTRADSNLFI